MCLATQGSSPLCSITRSIVLWEIVGKCALQTLMGVPSITNIFSCLKDQMSIGFIVHQIGTYKFLLQCCLLHDQIVCPLLGRWKRKNGRNASESELQRPKHNASRQKDRCVAVHQTCQAVQGLPAAQAQQVPQATRLPFLALRPAVHQAQVQ